MPKYVNQDEEPKGLSTKQIALIGVVVVVQILFIVAIFFGDDEKEEVQPPPAQTQVKIPVQTPAEIPQKTDSGNYDVGQFKVGADIPAGEYLAIGEGYVELSKDSSGNIMSIIFNDNFKGRHYIDAQDGEYIKLVGALKLYPVADAPKLEISLDKIPEGHYKIGVDIPAGEYKVTTEGNGYYAVKKSTRDKLFFVTNAFMPESQSRYVTVSDGQYFQIKNSWAKLER